jgi:hypothetical protein
MNDQDYTMAKAVEVFKRQEKTLDELVRLESKYKHLTKLLANAIGSR